MLRTEQKRLDTELAATNRSLSNLTADIEPSPVLCRFYAGASAGW